MRSTYAEYWVGVPRHPSRWRWALVAGGALAVWWWWPSAPPPAAPRPPPPDWRGLWVSGDALIRVRDGLKGEFSPDGQWVVPFAARADATALTFVARLDGRRMTLRLTRGGDVDTARLVGTPDYEGEPFVVIAPASKEERARDEERRRGRAGRLLAPVDFGTYTRAP
jgi:hypothetical protein